MDETGKCLILGVKKKTRNNTLFMHDLSHMAFETV
jgi:hypothetical protein